VARHRLDRYIITDASEYLIPCIFSAVQVLNYPEDAEKSANGTNFQKAEHRSTLILTASGTALSVYRLGYELDGPRFRPRNGGKVFRSCKDRPEAHPVPFPRVKRPGRGAEHPHSPLPLSVVLHDILRAQLYATDGRE
jgi:hypothetical protein